MFAFEMTIIVSWYTGLVAIGTFFMAGTLQTVFDRARARHESAMNENEAAVNARLIDVIRNGAKVKLMNQVTFEQNALKNIEKAGEGPRNRSLILKFYQEISYNFMLGLIPIIMGIVALLVVRSNKDSPQRAIDIGYSVLLGACC